MKAGSTPKIFLILSAFVALMLVSESIYVLRNNPDVRVRFYLTIARVFAKTSKVESSLKYIGKGAEIKLNLLASGYSQVDIKKEVTVPPIPDSKRVINDYKRQLKTLDYEKLANSYDAWGKAFYNFGVIAYRNDEPDLVVPFWQVASNIAPEWSYFHIELANYYLTQGFERKAEERLGYCLQFQHPKSFCQWYIDNHLEVRKPDTVGFLEGKINDEI